MLADSMATDSSAVDLLPPVAGVRIGCARAFGGGEDLMVVDIAPGATVAGLFTQNAFAAAPVQVCRKHLSAGGGIRGLIVNAGVANAGTGGRGLRDAEQSCQWLAALLGCRPEAVLPFSTGVIGDYLPMKRMERGLKKCAANLAADNWHAAARAILTGDSAVKGAFEIVRCGEQLFTVTGIAKGSGMIHPRMATMLAFVATDAAVPQRQLERWQRAAAAETFNAISVDGETSTNDSFALIATGKAGNYSRRAAEKIKKAVAAVCGRLADAIVRDGEGARKTAVITARGAKTRTICQKVAEAVATSPLVRMAVAGGHADAGRLLAAAGRGGCGAQNLNIKIGDVYVVKNGGTTSQRERTAAEKAMTGDIVDIVIELGDGPGAWTIKTCGMTRRYLDKFGHKNAPAHPHRRHR